MEKETRNIARYALFVLGIALMALVSMGCEKQVNDQIQVRVDRELYQKLIGECGDLAFYTPRRQPIQSLTELVCDTPGGTPHLGLWLREEDRDRIGAWNDEGNKPVFLFLGKVNTNSAVAMIGSLNFAHLFQDENSEIRLFITYPNERFPEGEYEGSGELKGRTHDEIITRKGGGIRVIFVPTE